ncbi:MAG: class I SAM-dependent methyltransferase [Desulfobacterales bacterium]
MVISNGLDTISSKDLLRPLREKQDVQAFYEDAALNDLIAHAEFEKIKTVFEPGCGTGRFAFRLLMNHLSSSTSYFGIDQSRTMADFAKHRIAPYQARATVALSDGSMRFPISDRLTGLPLTGQRGRPLETYKRFECTRYLIISSSCFIAV